jgi:anaerobic ribonucleoside-triphosphate reductase
MEVWSIFWICLFSYWTIKESVALLTYNKRQAIKDLVAKEYADEISELVNEKVKKFKGDKDKIRDALNDLINEIKD